MVQEKIIKKPISKGDGNFLISKFVGDYDGDWLSFQWIAGNFLYDEDYNRLMMAVEKIQSIDITPPPNYTGYRIEIVVQGYVQITGFPMPRIFRNVSREGSLRKAIWLAVTDFITYFNTLKTN